MMSLRVFFFIVLMLVVATTAFAQDKPNDKFKLVWDGGSAGNTSTIRRGWEIEAGFDLDKDGKLNE